MKYTTSVYNLAIDKKQKRQDLPSTYKIYFVPKLTNWVSLLPKQGLGS